MKDKYWNWINNHKIKLISSRYEDEFKNEIITNEKWIAEFIIKSDNPWISIFTAIDLNENIILQNREKIIFYNEKELKPMWWNLYLWSLIWNKWLIWNNDNDFGNIDHFIIETSEKMTLNDSNNYILIKAVDINWNIIKNYQWTILIEVPEDENASLPWDWIYTFKIEDLWEKKFYLSQTFTKIWDINLNVYEYENWKINENIKWTKKILILKELNTENNIWQDQNVELKIISPTFWTKIWSNQINISWKWNPYTSLKVFINEKKEWDNIEVWWDWIFNATIKWLLDWENIIYVSENEWNKRSSEEVKVYIDTQAPVINDLQIFPKNQIQKEDKFNITLYSEKNLSSVKIMIDWNIETLNEKIWEEWTYENNLIAPSYSWEFPIDIILVDQLWNKETFKSYSKLIVSEKSKSPPNKINNINLISYENSIVIKWDKPESINDIDEYKIYLWENEKNIEYFWSSKINDITIENLKSNNKYYIQISSIDIEWLESEKSNIKDIITKKEENFINEKIDNNEINNNNILEAISDDSWVNLKWKFNWNEINNFKIKYWINSNNLEEYIITKNNFNNYFVEDLINWLAYYFQVIWLDKFWNEITEKSNIIKSIPNWKWFIKKWAYFDKNKFIKIDNIDSIAKNKKWQNLKTWPEIWFVLAITILVTDIISRHRKWQNWQLKN